MVERDTVHRLIAEIEARLARLTSFRDVTWAEYQKSVAIRDQVERNFEVCIQACIDLGAHILADYPQSQPERYREVFEQLAANGILIVDLGDRLAKMAGFRNALVHGYADLSDVRVHDALNHLGDIRAYIEQMSSHLTATGQF